MIAYRKASFLTSAAELEHLPNDEGFEIAFAGRSNCGKSSTLNAICDQKQLARTSRTPGRTQLINFFELDAERRLVDLPGYGYAKVPPAMQARWEATLSAYLSERVCLKGLVLIMDARHPLKPLDELFINWLKFRELPIHILLNKADKLSKNDAVQTLKRVEKACADYPHLTVQLFSATEKQGIDRVRIILDQWFNAV